MSPRSRVIGILAGAAALVLAAGGVLAYKYYKRPGDQKPYIWTKHWTTLYMDPVYLGPGTSFGVVVRGGAKPWSRTEGTDFRFLVSDQWSPGGIGHLDGENDVYFASLGYYTLGACYVNDDSGKFVLNPSASGSELFDCDVAFNNYVVFWAPGYFNLQNTAAHEFGHALGLAHSEVPGAMMDPIGDFGEAAQFLHEDDEAGEVFLYPPPPGGGRGFPPPAIPLPTKAGTMSNLQVSAPQVMVGDPLEFSARVSNTSGVQLLLQGVETAPVSTGTFEPVVLEPGEVREVTVERTVGGLPGDYETRLRLGGYDPTAVYLAQQTLLSSLVRVRRPAVALPIQDELSGSLGPRGIETVEVFLVKGESFLLDLRGAPEWGGGAGAVLLDPAGAPVPGWLPAKAAKAKVSGVHRLVVANPTATPGNYRVFTEGLGNPPAIKGKGTLDGTGPVEVAFAAAARTSGEIAVKGSKKVAPRVVGLRSPSGLEVEVEAGAAVTVAEFGEDGIWTLLVEGLPGAAGKFSVKGKAAWVEGEERAP